MKKPINILHIEDDRADVIMILHELKKYWPEINHCQVEHLNDLQQALQKKWDVILSDFNLPEFDGLTALRLVRENDADTPFIVVSGRVEEEIAASMMRLGASDYVMKDNLNRLGPAILRELKRIEEKAPALSQPSDSILSSKTAKKNVPLKAESLNEISPVQHPRASTALLINPDTIRERHKAIINILYAANLIRRHQEKILDRQHISEPQFNTLSILRRQFPAATPMAMIKNESNKTSDISRAVERLVKTGLAIYAIDENDKRIRNISLTQKGFDVLTEMDKCAGEMFLDDTVLSEEQSKQINFGLQPLLAIMRER